MWQEANTLPPLKRVTVTQKVQRCIKINVRPCWPRKMEVVVQEGALRQVRCSFCMQEQYFGVSQKQLHKHTEAAA